VLKAALVRPADPTEGTPAQAVEFQYNPEKLHRRIVGKHSGPPQEIITCSLVFDATDALESPDENPLVVEHGIYPVLAALELLMHPRETRKSSWWPFWPFGSGSGLEHEPVLLFHWGDQRTVPVRVSRLDIKEEQHDPKLRPIRATVRLRMRVVTDRDLPRRHPDAGLWRQHLSTMQQLAGLKIEKTCMKRTQELGDLAASARVVDQLRKLVKSSRQRERSGLVALFAGPSGTGKTMAAKAVAGELGLDLHRVDLNVSVSKYIGETEKNLSRIFRKAGQTNAVLFFDEADALFGKRSEVKDSHDRYANIEVNHLLQRIEEHDGLVILATNLQDDIDQAFVRRALLVIDFP
jgi:hypothetical protein